MLKKLLLGFGIAVSLSTLVNAQGGEPIRIGLLTVDTGTFAFLRPNFTEPSELAVETINNSGGILGRKVELVVQSHSGTPAAALVAAQKLAQQDKALFMYGFNTGAMSAALAPRVAAWDSILLDTNSTFDDLTTKACNKNYFRTVNTDEMSVNMLKTVLEESGHKTWQILANDFVTGHAFADRFKAAVEKSGGTVLSSTFAPVNTPDWGSYISQLSAKPADGLALLIVGSDAVTLAKQAKQFGFFGKYKLVLSSHFTNEMVLDAQGDSTVGLYTAMAYSTEMPGDRNAAFVKLYTERYKRPPTFVAAEQWQAIEVMKAAIEKAGTTDVEAVRKALLGLKTKTITGDVEMRASDHQLLRPLGLVQVEAAGEGKAKMALRKIEPAAKLLPASTLTCD